MAIKPWHTGVFSAATIKGSPEILRFLEEEVLCAANKLFPDDSEESGGEKPSKILVLPGLPTQEPYRSQSVALLKERGVDGIISIRAMLLDLIDKVEVNRNYRKSDTLQIIRILKNYDLLRDAQLDLLSGGRSAKSS